MNSNRRRAFWTAAVTTILVTAASAGLAIVRGERPQLSNAPASAPALSVETVHIRPQAGFEMRRAFSGRVQARRDSVLGFEQGGRLSIVHVDEGALVGQGALIAELDVGRLEARRAELTAALAESEANLALAKVTLTRLKGVLSSGGVSRQGLDEARERQRAAEAALDLAQRRIASVDVDLGKARLYAPFPGTIVARLADEGRVLDTGEPVVRLQTSATPEIRIGVAGRSVDGLRAGDIYTLDWQGRALPARLRTVLPLRAASARTVDALFDPLESDAKPRPGDLVTLALGAPIAEPGAWLPVTALTEGERGLWSVYVTERADRLGPPEGLSASHRVVRRSVDVIHQEIDRVYVRGALTRQDRVVTTGLHRIVPGQWVRPLTLMVAQGGPSHD